MAYNDWGTVNPPWYVNIEFDGEKPGNAGKLGLESATVYNPEAGPLPSSGYTEKPRKRIPDYIDRWGLQFVSENFRQVVEELEPGLHEFFPFRLRNGKRGDPAPQQYYVMNIMTQRDCIDYEQSNVSVSCLHDGSIAFFSPNTTSHEGIVLKRDVIAGKHLGARNISVEISLSQMTSWGSTGSGSFNIWSVPPQKSDSSTARRPKQISLPDSPFRSAPLPGSIIAKSDFQGHRP